MNEHVAIKSNHDFAPMRAAMQRYVDGEILAGVSWALLEGRDIVDMQAVGFSDRDAKDPLRFDHIFRAFSNTKLVTSCAIMLLVEDGRIGLDTPIEKYIP